MLDSRAILACAMVTFAVLMSSAAAAPQQSPPDQRGETTLRVGAATRPDSLNPLVSKNRLGRALTSVLYDELLPVDREGKPLPALVHKWTRSNDGRLWLLDIRAGARWSDGAPVTARDVVHTLKRIKNGPRNRFSGWLEEVSRIDRFARLRVGIQLERPARTPPPLPIPVLPRHVWRTVQIADVADFANEPPIGSGPFTTDGADGDTLVLTARRKHWRGEPVVDTVELSFFDSQNSMVAALEAAEIDVADDVEPEFIPRLERTPEIDIRAADATAFVSLGVNTGSSTGNGDVLLRQARVRRAIATALDRDALRQAVLGPYGDVGSTIVPPSHPDHAEPTVDSELGFDPERAGSLLDRAGIVDHDGDGVREVRAGMPLELRLFTRLARPETERLGDLIAAALGEVGVTVTVTALTDRELSQRIRRGRYDLFLWGWDVANDPSFVVSVLTCAETGPAGRTDTHFCDADYDRLYERFIAARSASERSALLGQLQQRAYDRVPYVVLYYRPTFQAFRADRFAPPADDAVPLLFASAPESPVELELLPGQTPGASSESTAEEPASAAPANDLVEEIRSSLLWQLLAAAAVAILVLLLLPRVVRGVLRLRRSRHRRRLQAADESESAVAPSEDTGEIGPEGAPAPDDEPEA